MSNHEARNRAAKIGREQGEAAMLSDYSVAAPRPARTSAAAIKRKAANLRRAAIVRAARAAALRQAKMARGSR